MGLVKTNGSGADASGGAAASLNPADGGLVGVNTNADATNRLSVASPASKFDGDGGGHVMNINKASTGDDATLKFQDNWSGRAEIGLAGDDDFHFKVSADGSSWHEGIVIDASTGAVSFPSGGGGGIAGGTTGQVPVKQSANDYDLGWSGNVTIDPATGRLGAGTDTPQGPLHGKGADASIILENALAPDDYWVIAPGRGGWYGSATLWFSHGTKVNQNPIFSASDKGILLFENKSIKGPLGDITQYVPWTGTKSYVRFSGPGSVEARMDFESWYYDGSGYGSAASRQVMSLLKNSSGMHVAIGKNWATATLDVNGSIRCASYTVATLPDAANVGAGAMVYVSDESGGAVMAFSDGTDWRRMTDRGVVS